MQLSSPAFKDGEQIPVRYTCNGEDISPPLQWEHVPEETGSFVLICEDPDAPNETWSHWVLYNLPPSMRQLEAEIAPVATFGNDAMQGMNDFGNIAYGGPCPPDGQHQYIFRLFALDMMLDMEEGATREEVLRHIRPYVLAESQLLGVYGEQ